MEDALFQRALKESINDVDEEERLVWNVYILYICIISYNAEIHFMLILHTNYKVTMRR